MADWLVDSIPRRYPFTDPVPDAPLSDTHAPSRFDEWIIDWWDVPFDRVNGAPFPIAAIGGKPEYAVAQEVLWRESEDDEADCVTIWGTGPSTAELPARHRPSGKASYSVILYAQLQGVYSDAGIESATEERGLDLRSIFKSIALCEGSLTRMLGQIPELRADISEDELRRHLGIFSQALGLYMPFNPFASKKGPTGLARRLPVAMIMLSEADKQQREAVAISLGFSAIEALLGGGKSDITKTLSENDAALLEPDRFNRPAAAKVVKELYDVRSKFIHGEKLDHAQESLDQVRLLAACTLRALLGRSGFEGKLHAQLQPDAYLAELQNDFATGQPFTGWNEQTASQRLWRVNAPGSAQNAGGGGLNDPAIEVTIGL